MNNKLLVAVLATVSVFALTIGLTACGEKPHEHTYETTVTAPTCTEQGYTTHTCSCGDSYVDTYVNALGHNYDSKVTAPTCTEQGYTTHTCSCGDSYVDSYVNALEHNFTNYVSDGNATYEKDGTKTATCDRDGCNEIDTITDEGSKLKSGISFKTLSVTGTDVYGKVSNTTETFSFINEVTTVGTAKFVVSLDIYGVQQVATKTIPLTVGDNTVYITETVDDEPINVYTVTVRRRPMYEVTFNANGGTSVESQTVEEDSLVSQPTTTKMGYTFKAWDYDFSKPITKATEIQASWTANTNTPYKVEYYLQNLANDEYTLETTENKTGTTDTTAKAELKPFTHFTHTASTTDSGNIAPDGSTVLKVYYTRDTYTVTFDGNGGTLVSGTEIQTVKYGGSVTAPTYERIGYTFSDYDKTNYTNISESFTVTATWTINQYTLTIVYDNGQDNRVITQDYNTSIESIANPERVGYDFAGWDKELPTAMPAEDKTITAKWNAIFTISGSVVTGLTDYGKSNYTKINIPSQIDGTTITSIGSSAFSGCNYLTSVVIPDSVTSIGQSAFSGCDYLTGVVIPDSVTSIGQSAFSGCDYLTSVTIPDSVTSIGSSAFEYCSRLTSVTIPDSVISIGSSAFEYCSRLTSVTIGNNVTSIGEYAFYNCSRLTSVHITDMAAWCKISFLGDSSANPLSYAHNLYLNNELVTELVITDSVTSIGDNAFYEYSSLTSVTIPDSVTSIGSSAFYDCSGLTSIIIPDSVTSIGYKAFYGCNSLTSVTIGNSVTSIGSYAFYNCTGLTEINYSATECADLSSSNYLFYNAGRNGTGITVTIGANVKKIPTYLFYPYSDYCSPKITGVVFEEGSVCENIGSSAFRYCNSLTSVTIPGSVTSMGEYAFGGCSGLVGVYIADIAAWCKISFGNIYANPLSYAHNLYLNNELVTELVITDSVTSIGDNAFYECSSLTSVMIDTGLTSIGSSAFQYCSSLKSVTIGTGLTSIGSSAFYECNSLTSVTIPDSVTSIGSSAFYDCSSLTSIIIPDSVTSIGYKAFYYCSSLTSVTIGTGLSSIGEYVFCNCSSLTNIIVNENNKSYKSIDGNLYTKDGTTLIQYAIGKMAETFTIPDSVTSIGLAAFFGCSCLKSINIYNSVTSIGAYAFQYCSSLMSVTIPDSVESIGDCAFQYCSSLTSVTMGAGVTSIGSRAFSGCSRLTSVTIPEGVTHIGSYAFYDCSRLTSVTFTNTSDWRYFTSSTDTSGTSISSLSLANTSTAATYLRSTYYNYYWKRLKSIQIIKFL